jgi:hypothetical protein
VCFTSLLAFELKRFLFPLVEPVVADLPLALLGYGGLCVFVLFVFFLLVSSMEIQLKKSSLGSSRPPVSSTVCYLAGF